LTRTLFITLVTGAITQALYLVLHLHSVNIKLFCLYDIPY